MTLINFHDIHVHEKKDSLVIIERFISIIMYKTCLFCDQVIPYRATTCREHREWSKLYANTTWYQELVKLQSRQTRINSFECYPLIPAIVDDTHIIHGVKDNKAPLKDRQTKIKELYKSGVKIKEIAKDVDMKYHAVYMYLKRNNCF